MFADREPCQEEGGHRCSRDAGLRGRSDSRRCPWHNRWAYRGRARSIKDSKSLTLQRFQLAGQASCLGCVAPDQNEAPGKLEDGLVGRRVNKIAIDFPCVRIKLRDCCRISFTVRKEGCIGLDIRLGTEHKKIGRKTTPSCTDGRPIPPVQGIVDRDKLRWVGHHRNESCWKWR